MQATALSLASTAGLVSFNTAFALSGGRIAMTTGHDGSVTLVTPATVPAPANDNVPFRLVRKLRKARHPEPVRKVAMDPERMFAATNREFLPWS